jgi:adenosylmethionine---8-amino-7-oxononanoate aminotransferase
MSRGNQGNCILLTKGMGIKMNLVEKDLKYIWHPCSQMKDYETLKPIVIERGRGEYLYDKDGKEYIDIVSSWWCNLLGHCNPVINQEMKEQLDKLEHVIFANFTHEPAIRLCEELIKIIPERLTKFNFSDNGSASVECALKMAFQYQYQTGHSNRKKFMCFTDAYHGETIGALSVGSLDLYAKIYHPMLMDTIHIQAPDCYRCSYDKTRDSCDCECFEKAEQVFEAYGYEVCAIIVEPLLQASAGMRIYPALYLKNLRKLCDQYGVILIADEIATGFGRTGKMFAFNHGGVSPDIMCISKGLTGGYIPMAITVTTDEIYNAFYAEYSEGKAFMHSHTYSGNPLGCAAALAVQKIFQEEAILEKAAIRADYLNKRLNQALKDDPNIGEIRHIGLIHALELTPDRATKAEYAPGLRVGYQIYKKALQQGLLLRPLGNVLYFNPPLIISENAIDNAIDVCVKCMHEVVWEIGKVEKILAQ